MLADKYIQSLSKELDARFEALTAMSRKIWENPELGYQEYLASGLLSDMLEENGFDLQRGISGMDTAFLAVKKSGKPGPVIAFVAEYDALPKIGHGCGHNLFCCSAVGAGIALSHIQETLGGEVRVIGSPAEEGTVENYGAKVILVEKGYFDDVDCVLTAHGEGETVIDRHLVAAITIKVHFKGFAVHCGGDPTQGKNALTAGMLCINNMNAIRQQHLPCDVVNSIITDGGLLSNTIPDSCSLEFSIRSDTAKNLARVRRDLENSAKAAALVTGCDYKMEVVKNPMKDTKSNHQMGLVMAEYLDSIGESYKQEDSRNFAWDVGDICYACPTLGSYFKMGPEDIICHTDGFCQAANSDLGYRGMLLAAKGMGAVACEYMVDPELRARIAEEFKEKISE